MLTFLFSVLGMYMSITPPKRPRFTPQKAQNRMNEQNLMGINLLIESFLESYV